MRLQRILICLFFVSAIYAIDSTTTSVAAALLERLHRELFAAYAMVAYESEVRVMRPEKF